MSATMDHVPVPHEVEVAAKAQRRRFTAAEKLRALREADRCAKPGDPRDRKIAELERETRRLQARLEHAEGLIEVQRKSRSCWAVAMQLAEACAQHPEYEPADLTSEGMRMTAVQ